MKRDDMFSAFSGIQDRYVDEARPKRKTRTPKQQLVRFCALVATLAIVVGALGAWLFIPYNVDPTVSIKQYRGSQYYSIIEKINAFTFEYPRYKNNFEKLTSDFGEILSSTLKGDVNMDMEPEDMENNVDDEMSGEMTGNGYEEVTDNQVAGVIEADRIKRTTTHFFYLYDMTLRVYSILGEASECVAEYKIPLPDNMAYNYSGDIEFYLSEDGERISLVLPYVMNKVGACYDVITIDVSNPGAPKETARLTVAGNYISSRMVNGMLLLVGEYYIKADPDYDNESTYLPQINTGDGFKSFEPEDIITPDAVSNRRYTVLSMLDEETLTVTDTLAVLCTSDILYATSESLYLTNSYRANTVLDGYRTTETLTDVIKINFAANTFASQGKFTVSGFLENQYSMDEYEGKFRLVTTTDKSVNKVNSGNNSFLSDTDAELFESDTSASLYVFDAQTLELLASVENFAPKGETVESVRFDKDYAYVCTAMVVELTDPVFFFDLSDLENITYKDTGVIEGFSSSLIQMGNGFLLGIGRADSWNSVKIEVYEESENGVVSVATYELSDAQYVNEYKSYLINREKGLFGFGFEGYNGSGKYSAYYVVLLFDGYDLHEVKKVELNGGVYRRAVLVDEYIYFFGETFIVDKLF